ncbi:MAG: thioesterase domain-containing protein [Hyphomicrobium sp.]
MQLTDLERSLIAAYSRVLGCTRIELDDNVFELGGDALNVARLVDQVKLATGLDVSPSVIERSPTIKQLVCELSPSEAQAAALVVPLQSSGSGAPLYCLCGIELYRDLAKSLGDDQPVYGVYVASEIDISTQIAQGLPPQIALERMSEEYLKAILRLRHGGPYRLAGFSAGGIIAMQVASRLRMMGEDVQCVFLIDSVLPSGANRNWIKWFRKQTAELSYERLMMLAARLPTGRSRVETPDAVLGGDAALSAAVRSWQPRYERTDFKTVLYRATEHMQENGHINFDPSYGWGQLVVGPLMVEDTAGSHLSLVRPPNVETLARSVKRHFGGAA